MAKNHGKNFVEVTQLSLGDTISVQMGNPGDHDFEREAEMVVLQIHRGHIGWQILAERDHKNRQGDESKQLCVVTPCGSQIAGRTWRPNVVPYVTTMGLTVGNMNGETREKAIANLHFAPE